MRLQTMSDDCSAQNGISSSIENNASNNKSTTADINKLSSCLETMLTSAEPSSNHKANHKENCLYAQDCNTKFNLTDHVTNNNSIQDHINNDHSFTHNHLSLASKNEEFSEFNNCSFQSNNCDEFADFTDFTSFNNNDGNFENFANFESNSQVNEDSSHLSNDKSDDLICEDEFADFESAPNDNALNHQNTPISNIQSACSNDPPDYNKIFQDTFQSSTLLSEELGCTISSNIFDHCSFNSQMLWSNLQKIDLKSNYYTDKWKDSQSFKHLLQSLKIDKRKMMNSEILPVYVASLGQILQPVQPNSTEAANKSSLSESTNKRAESKDSFCDFQPVFNLNQDLDFFESKYSYNTCDKTNVKDDLSEFENIMLDKCHNDNGEKQQVSSSQSSVKDLKEMLKNPIAQSNNEQVLSAEALQILSELPNLSFIRAKVLMFPMNEK